jgi:hypothetical protein
VDNRLAYIDQTFLLSVRALEHQPITQFTWVYEHGVDLDALREFQRNLCQGLLRRRVERSPLPFGRPRWVNWPGPSELDVAAVPLTRQEAQFWLEEQAERPLDPETGPPWRLAVLPLVGGGAVVTLIASHVVTDGVGLQLAIVDAVNGKRRELRYPEPDSRARGQAIREDLVSSWRSLSDVATAMRSIRAAAEDAKRWNATASQSQESQAGQGHGRRPSRAANAAVKRAKKASIRRNRHRPVQIFREYTRVDIPQWDERAKALDGNSTALWIAVAARIAKSLGSVSPDGLVHFAIPVSDRVENDERGNALNGVPLVVDPEAVLTDLKPIRTALKAALVELDGSPNSFVMLLPITTLIPKFMARLIESVTISKAAVTCSYVGDMNPASNQVDGSEAEYFMGGGRWVRMDCRMKPIQRAGGMMFPVGGGRMNGSVFVNPVYATTDPSFTLDRFRQVVAEAMTDFGLTSSFVFAESSREARVGESY